MRTKRYLFGRLNLLLGNASKKQLLWDAVSSSTFLERRGNRWGIFDAQELSHEGYEFLSARLVKFRPLSTDEVVDAEHHRLTTENIEDRVEAKSRFFVHLASGLLAFEDASPAVAPAAFRLRTAELINEALGGFFANAEIQVVDEQLSFLSVVERFERLTKFVVVLHPSNPSNRDVWSRVDQRLRTLEVSRYREEFVTSRDCGGRALLSDEELRAKTFMAEDGYGEAKVTGFAEGRLRTVSTRDNPVSDVVDASLDQPGALLTALWERFRLILARFTE